MNRSPRRTIDLSELTPGSLDKLDDEDFRLVVDADVKKTSAGGVQSVPEWVSTALRTELVDRWHVTLKRMLASVQGQLDAKASDHEAEKSRLALLGENVKIEELNVRHFQKRSQSLRFRSGLTDVLLEAEGVVALRSRRFEDAIIAHRAHLVAHPRPADLALWSTLED